MNSMALDLKCGLWQREPYVCIHGRRDVSITKKSNGKG